MIELFLFQLATVIVADLWTISATYSPDSVSVGRKRTVAHATCVNRVLGTTRIVNDVYVRGTRTLVIRVPERV